MKGYRLLYFLLLVLLVQQSKAQVTAGFNVIYQNPNCAPTTVTFLNTSIGTNLTYEWNFGLTSGVNSVLQNPSAAFLNCGIYDVTLIATNQVGEADTLVQSIQIFCNPIADFTATPTSGCIPLDVIFTNNSIVGGAPITSYFWDFGDGNSGSGNNPTHTYTISGCKNITLQITDANGCSHDTSFTNLICIDDQPVSAFSSTTNVSCSAPFTIDFTNNSTGTGTLTYQWTFAGGNPSLSSLPNPSVTYNTPGVYDVTLVVTNGSGCSDTLTINNYAAIASNLADFTMSSGSGCVPFTLNVQGISSSAPISWNWTTNPLAIPPSANTQNATFVFNSNGTYQVCLDVTYPGGCIASKCSTVVVSNYPHASFTLTGNTYTCTPPQIIDYNNTSTGGPSLQYNWQFPGGVPSSWNNSNPPNVSYNNCGIYDAILIVTNLSGCSDTFVYAGAANIDCPQASFSASPNAGCAPLNTDFLYTGSSGNPTSWLWNFGDPSSGVNNTSTLQNPSHIFNNTGCYTITLLVSNAQGCSDTIHHFDMICVGSPPIPDFSASPVVTCAWQEVVFTDSSQGIDSTTSWQWDFIGVPPFDVMNTSQNPSYLYPDTGWFDVTLVLCNSGCCDTLTIDSMIHILPPIANFTVTNNCLDPYNITFNGGASIGADTFYWSSSAGTITPVSDSVISISFPSNGNYDVQLIVENYQTGCYDTLLHTVLANNVIADFSASDTAICAPGQICFTNLSQNATSYEWFLFNGIGNLVWTNTNLNPCRNFLNPGKFSVMLVATDANGCTDTMYKQFYIHAYGLNLNLTGAPLTGCVPLSVSFTSVATSSVSTLVSWFWNFGDSASGVLDTSSLLNPVHTYNNAGSYDVTLIAEDNNGCYDTLTVPQYINPYDPQIDFIALDSTVCLGETTCFFNQSQGGSLSYFWNFGDGNSSNLFNPCHQYTSIGDYTVTLIGTDTSGCIDSLVRTLYIHVTSPAAFFTANPVYSSCPPLPVNFTNSSTGVDANTVYQWTFGDGSNSNVQSPFHIYNFPGFYDVSLIITNQYGCSDTLVIDSLISITGPTATVNVTPTSGCNPLNVCFYASSNTTTSYTWDFGDGTIIPNSNDTICYTYNNPGIFHPALILDNGAGCTYSFPIDSIIAGGPDVHWHPDVPYLCQSGIVNFTDSTFGVSPAVSWLWTFGDSLSGALDTSLLQNPSHFFDTLGTYIITLLVTSANGCTGVLTDTVFVTPPPVIGIISNTVTSCVSSTVSFNYNSSIPITNLQWNFGDPASGANDSSILSTPAHTYNAAGTYTVTLIAQGVNFCSDTSTINITVVALPSPSATSDTSICPVTSAQLNSSNGISYSWSPPSFLNSTTISNPVSSPTANITYTVTVIDANGCTGYDSVAISIFNSPIITATAADDSICSGVPVQLNGFGGIQYSWLPAGVLNNSLVQNPVATIFNTTQFDVTGTDANGCTGSGSLTVTVVPAPIADAGPDADYCIGGSTQLNATGGLAFTWSPANALSCTNCQSPIANPVSTETYTVSVIDSNGCIGTDAVIVTVNPLPSADAGNDVTICLGMTGVLNASGGLVYNWTPPTYLSGTSAQNPTCTPFSNITYTVTVTDANLCTANDSVVVTVIPLPVFDAWGDTTVCQYDLIQLHASGGNSYSWIPNNNLSDASSPSPFASPHNSTNYSVIISDSICNISDTLQVVVTIIPVPTAFAGGDITITAGSSYTIDADASDNFNWSPGEGLSCTTCEDPVATPLETTTYTLTAENDFGCRAVDSMVITILCSEDILYIPNAFSPNGNGKNDLFRVRADGIRELNFLRVYDRWGELVFETSDKTTGWDGTYKGEKLPPAVYVWYLRAVCGDGFIIERQGNVTLMK